MHTRRTLLTAVGATLLAASHAVTAQTGKRRIAYLAGSSPPTGGPFLTLFTTGLNELGWIEGSNLIFDIRWAQGDPTRYAPLTSELLALQPDVFVATLDSMLGPAMAATKAVPIVFIQGSNPVGRGVVKSLGRPGGNVTGFATVATELDAKRLQLLKEAVPGLNKVGVFVSSQNIVGLGHLDEARRILRLELVPALIDRPEDIEVAFEQFANAGVKAVLHATGSPHSRSSTTWRCAAPRRVPIPACCFPTVTTFRPCSNAPHRSSIAFSKAPSRPTFRSNK